MPNNPITDAESAELDRWLGIANQPYHAKRKAAKTHAQYMVTQLVPALRQRLTDAESRLAAAERERDEVRTKLRVKQADLENMAIQCGQAKGLLRKERDERSARDSQQRREGAAAVWDIVAERSKLVGDAAGETYATEAAKRLREGK